jgi:hypothetical protein
VPEKNGRLCESLVQMVPFHVKWNGSLKTHPGHRDSNAIDRTRPHNK